MGRVEGKDQSRSLMKLPELSARVLIYAFNSASHFLLHLLLLKFSDVNVNRHAQNPPCFEKPESVYVGHKNFYI